MTSNDHIHSSSILNIALPKIWQDILDMLETKIIERVQDDVYSPFDITDTNINNITNKNSMVDSICDLEVEIKCEFDIDFEADVDFGDSEEEKKLVIKDNLKFSITARCLKKNDFTDLSLKNLKLDSSFNYVFVQR